LAANTRCKNPERKSLKLPKTSNGVLQTEAPMRFRSSAALRLLGELERAGGEA
jgi:hypothetical protein